MMKLDNLYMTQLARLDGIRPRRNSTESLTSTNLINFLTYKYLSFFENYADYSRNDDTLTGLRTRIEDLYREKLPDLYEMNLKDISGEILRYRETDSLEKKYAEGFRLVKKYGGLEPMLTKIIENESAIATLESYISPKYSGNIRFSVIYLKKIKPLFDLAATSKQETDLEKRIRQGNGILRNLTNYKMHYGELQAVDSLIEIRENQVLGDFRSNYPGQFKADLSYYTAKGDAYDQADSLQIKLEAGNTHLQELSKLRVKYDTLRSYQKGIQEKLPLVIEIYKNKQPNIYTNEIVPLERQTEEFRVIDDLIPRISKGKEIITSLTFLSGQIDSLNYYDAQIQFYFVKVRDEYKKTYRAIYKKDIEPYDVEVTKFKNSTTVDQKVDKGRSFLAKLVLLDEQFNTLQTQVISMDQMIEAENRQYKKRYSEIRKYEIGEIENSYSEYKKKEVIVERIALGGKLIEHLEYLSANYDKLVSVDTSTERRIPLVATVYKKNYPGLYSSEIKELKKQKDDFRAMKSLEQKLVAGRNIDQRIIDLSAQYDALQAVDKLILDEYNKFESLFAKNKKQKVIYKKGKKVFSYYYDNFKEQQNAKECFSCGRLLEVLMKKINTYAEGEDPNLIKELRKLKKPEEIRKAFGI
jgi:hypothetical protein